MLEAIFAATCEQQSPARPLTACLPLCAPAVVVERSMAHGLLALSSLVVVAVQALANGVTSPADPGSAEAGKEAAAPAATTVPAAAAHIRCRAPLVTREAFAAWADGLIARRIGRSR